MSNIYFLNDEESFKMTPDKGYLCANWFDVHECIEKYVPYPEYDTIQKIINEIPVSVDTNKAMLDIGANVGVYTFNIGKYFKQVYSIEPNKYFNYILHANVALYDMIDKVKIINCLLSDNTESVSYNGFACNMGNFLQQYREAEMVEPITLDMLDLDDIGFIKIDVEGMEEKVLRGGQNTLLKNDLPPILFEAWDENSSDLTGIDGGILNERKQHLFNYLDELGYYVLDKWGDFETHLAVKKGTQI